LVNALGYPDKPFAVNKHLKMKNLTEQSIVDGFLFNRRKPSEKKLEFLEQEFQQGFDAVAEAVSLNIADGTTCEEFDLPQGSYWIQVIASLLDLKAPVKEEMPRLAELNKELIYYGHLEA